MLYYVCSRQHKQTKQGSIQTSVLFQIRLRERLTNMPNSHSQFPPCISILSRPSSIPRQYFTFNHAPSPISAKHSTTQQHANNDSPRFPRPARQKVAERRRAPPSWCEGRQLSCHCCCRRDRRSPSAPADVGFRHPRTRSQSP